MEDSEWITAESRRPMKGTTTDVGQVAGIHPVMGREMDSGLL